MTSAEDGGVTGDIFEASWSPGRSRSPLAAPRVGPDNRTVGNNNEGDLAAASFIRIAACGRLHLGKPQEQ